MDDSKLNLATLSALFSNEDEARRFLELKRWPSGPVCPRCQCNRAYTIQGKADSKKPARKGLYKCAACRKQFTVTVGTIFEDGKVPISKWLMAIHLMCSSKKGVSAKQIEREVGVTYKTAWFICHRIREAMKQEPLAGMLGTNGGTVETDETYVGGKAKNAHGDKIPEKKPVSVLVERGGNVCAKHVERVTAREIRKHIVENVHRGAKLVGDDATAYIGLSTPFTGGRSVVRHSRGEYVNVDGEHINTAESFNALLKRGHYGIYHSMSKKHLHRYCEEFAFRWNQRKVTDGERMVSAIEGAEGKRLLYKNPVSS